MIYPCCLWSSPLCWLVFVHLTQIREMWDKEHFLNFYLCNFFKCRNSVCLNTYMPEMGIRSLYTWSSEEQPVFLSAEPLHSPEKGFYYYRKWLILLASSQSIPGQVFQGFIRKQAEEPWVTRPISNVSPWPVLHFLAWVSALTPLKDGVGSESCKIKQSFPSKLLLVMFYHRNRNPNEDTH